MTAAMDSPPRSGSHSARSTVDSDARAAIDRSMPPHSTTKVAPAASTASGAAVLTAAVRLRWLRKSGSARLSAVTSATRAMTGMNDVTRSARVGPPLTTTGSTTSVRVVTGALTPSP